MKLVLLVLLVAPLRLSIQQQQQQQQPGKPTVSSNETSSLHPSSFPATSPSTLKNNSSVTPQNASSSSPVPTVTTFTSTIPSSASTNKTTSPATAKPTTHTAVTRTTSKTVPSTSATATPKATVAQIKASGFSVGSFIGGIVLTLVLLAIGYIGCRTYHAKRGVQYRTIDEHDAII